MHKSANPAGRLQPGLFPAQASGEDDKQQGNCAKQGNKGQGPFVFAGEHGVVDFQGDGVGSAGYVAAQHQGDADLAQGAGKGQGQADGNAGAQPTSLKCK